MNVCMYACIYIRMNVCMYVCMYIRMYVQTCSVLIAYPVRPDAVKTSYVCMHACMYVSYVCMYHTHVYGVDDGIC